MNNIPTVVVPGQPLAPEYDSDAGHNIKYTAGPGSKLEFINIEGKEVPVIISTILGKVKLFERESEPTEGSPVDKQYIICVIGKSNEYSQLKLGREEQEEEESMDIDTPVMISKSDEKSLLNNSSSSLLPQENDIVLCRVIKIATRQAYVEIIAIEKKGLISKDSGLNANNLSAGQSSLLYSSIASSSLSNNASDVGENFKGIIRLQDIRSTDRDKLKIFENFKPGDILRAIIISKGDGTNYYLSTSQNDLGVVFAKAKNGEGDVMYALDWETMIEPTTGDVELRKCAKPF